MKKATLILGVVLVLMSCTRSTEDLAAVSTDPSLNMEAKPNNIWTEVMDPFTSFYSIPIICDGVEVGRLEGEVSVFCRMLWRGEALDWMIMEFTGQLGDATGEVFTVKDIRKYNADRETFNAHIHGDRGSRYIISGTIAYEPYTVSIKKAVCPPSN